MICATQADATAADVGRLYWPSVRSGGVIDSSVQTKLTV